MQRRGRIWLLALSALVAIPAGYAGLTRIRSPESSASADSYRLWIAMIKGFDGDVRYVGSDGTNEYFRFGRLFWSYYKLRSCAVQPPETFSVRSGRSYVVRLHVGPGNMVNIENTCDEVQEYQLGKLDRLTRDDA
jgi:hypothetical protein